MPLHDVQLAYCQELVAIARRPRPGQVGAVLASRMKMPVAVAHHIAVRQTALWPSLARNGFLDPELWAALADIALRHGAGSRTASWLAATGLVRGFDPGRTMALATHGERHGHRPQVEVVSEQLSATVNPLPRALLDALAVAPGPTSDRVLQLLGEDPAEWEAFLSLVMQADDPELFPVQGAAFVKRAAQEKAARAAAVAARAGAPA